MPASFVHWHIKSELGPNDRLFHKEPYPPKSTGSAAISFWHARKLVKFVSCGSVCGNTCSVFHSTCSVRNDTSSWILSGKLLSSFLLTTRSSSDVILLHMALLSCWILLLVRITALMLCTLSRYSHAAPLPFSASQQEEGTPANHGHEKKQYCLADKFMKWGNIRLCK